MEHSTKKNVVYLDLLLMIMYISACVSLYKNRDMRS